MAITRMSNLGIASLGSEKYNDILAGLPGVMPAPTAADGGTGTTATVSFSAVAGTTSYTAISNPGSFTGTAASSPVTVSGLTAGTAYTFQIRGNNSAGAGAYSAASNSVTPVVPTAFESIASANGTGSNTSITFSSIPQTFTHLQLRSVAISTASGGAVNYVRVQINGITSSIYTNNWVYWQGGLTIQSDNTNTMMYGNRALGGSQFNANDVSGMILDINDYSSSVKNKTIFMHSGFAPNRTGDNVVQLGSGMPLTTSAITSITLESASGSFATESRFSLYGIKGA